TERGRAGAGHPRRGGRSGGPVTPPAVAKELDPTAIPEDVRALARRLNEKGFQGHLVGGGVRDMLVGRPPVDFDIATDAKPEKVLEIFGHAYAIPTGLQHGTVTVLTGRDPATRRSVEVTTFRGEGAYLDGRRPSSVTYVSSLDEDLS